MFEMVIGPRNTTVISSSNGARLPARCYELTLATWKRSVNVPLICLGCVIQNGFASHVGKVPGIMLVTSSYWPGPPTFVYLSALSEPVTDAATRLFGVCCAPTYDAERRAARETKVVERRMLSRKLRGSLITDREWDVKGSVS